VSAPGVARSGLALSLFVLLSASSARADGLDVQVSSRLDVGGGVAFSPELEGVFDLGARVDLLVGDDRPSRVRLGPELELRTATFQSIELTLGPALLLPVSGDFTLGLVIGGGYAWRLPRALDPSRDGVVVSATLRVGYQPYDHYDPYSMGLHVYLTGRAGFLDQEAYEVILGLEVDLELIFVAPFMFLVTALSGHDPDEPAREESP
jgi:hypothetical protein